MTSDEFKRLRKKLEKTQKQTAGLLGVSLKAIHSYEQGWRRVPVAVERQLYFLATRKMLKNAKPVPCWNVKDCTDEQKSNCPAWELDSGDLCWFVNGTMCNGMTHKSWKEKMEICRTCDVLKPLLQ